MKENASSYQLERVRFAYDRKPVLHELELTLPSGKLIAIAGPNGCGKSTLLGLLSRTLEPAAGRILLRDLPLTAWPRKKLAQTVAYLPQREEFGFAFTVREIAAMGRYPHTGRFGGLGKIDWDNIDAALAAQQMAELADAPVTELSGGEQKRAGLARVRAQRAEVWLLDEPTASLDVHHALELLESLKKEVNGGMTVIAVLHDLGWIFRYADWCVLLDEGRLVADGPVREVLTEKRIRDVFHVDCVMPESPSGAAPYLSLPVAEKRS